MLADDSSPFVPQQFSSDIADNASTVCLAHLFTYQDFDEGTLGLAYVAPSKPQALGGLCPKRKETSLSGKIAYNIYVMQHLQYITNIWLMQADLNVYHLNILKYCAACVTRKEYRCCSLMKICHSHVKGK